MTTPFADILQEAVDATPGAIGGAFAAHDGETVDWVSEWSREEWAVLTAHYGVVFHHVQSALHTFHFGEAKQVVISHERMHLLVHTVVDGYYALMALSHPPSLARAMQAMERAALLLEEEMG